MDWFDTSVRLVGVLAWPGVVAGLAFGFRESIGRQLDKLGDKVSEVSIGKATARFRASANAALYLAEAVAPGTPPEQIEAATGLEGGAFDGPQTRRLEQLLAAADRDPRGAVFTSWALVFQLGSQLAAMEGRPLDDRLGDFMEWIGSRFTGMNLPPNSLGAVLHELNRLFQEVATAAVDPDPNAAKDFVRASWRVAAKFEDAIKRQVALSPREPLLPSQVDPRFSR